MRYRANTPTISALASTGPDYVLILYHHFGSFRVIIIFVKLLKKWPVMMGLLP